MRKFFIDMEKSSSKATLALLFLSILTLAAAITPIVQAENMSVALNPSEGPPGTIVLMVIYNVQTPNILSITFGTTNIGTITARTASTVNMDLSVPKVSTGTYTVTVTGSTGGVATKTFTVTQAAAPTPEETPVETPEETSIWVSPTDSPATGSTGFWSPLTVAIIAAVIALASFTTFLYVRRGKQETSSVQDSSPHKPGSSVQDTPLYNSRSSVSSMKSTAPTRVSQTVANSSQPPFTKVCKHCKQNVRDDLNVCPYCFKRLR